MTLTAIIMQFLAPPLVFIWLSMLGLLFSFKRFGRGCMVLGMLLLFLSSIPGIGLFISMPLLETNTNWSVEELKGADAIVVPTGGYFLDEIRFVSAEHSIRRGDYGVWLQQQTGLPLIFTGGRTYHPQAPAESEVLRRILNLSPEKVWTETKSMNSYEHAVYLEQDFSKRGWDKKIVLVSSAMHMMRLSASFRARGFEVIPVSVHDHVTDFKHDADFWEYVFPSWEGLKIFRRAFYSYAGTFSYLVRGRISVSDLFHSGPSYLAAPSSWLGRD